MAPVQIELRPEGAPEGREIRRVTGEIQGAREGRGAGRVALEVWNVVMIIALSGAFVAGVATVLQDAVPAEDAAEGGLLLGPVPAGLLLAVAAGALLSLAGRLGPVGVPGGGSAWWLPMPVGRRGLLRPTVLAWPAVGAATGLVLGALVVILLEVPDGVAVPLGWAALGAGVFSLVVAVALLAQHQGRGTGGLRVARIGEGIMLLAVGVVALLALTGAGSAVADLAWPGLGLTWLAVPCVLAAVGMTVVAERRSAELDGAALRAQGSVMYRAQAALLSLDLRELSRTLTTTSLASSSARTRRRGSLPLNPGGPRRAVVLADLVLLVRTPRSIGQLAVAVVLGAGAAGIALISSGVPLYLTWVVTGFWAAGTAAAGARHADLVPAVDRLLPLSTRSVRVVRGVVPLVAATLWSVVTLGSQALRTGDPTWLLLALAWAPALAAAAMRSAYRPPPKWSRAVVATPMGSVPPTGGFFQGLDVATVATLPTAVALLLGGLAPVVVGIQAAMTVVVVAVLVGVAGRKPSG